MAKPKSSPPPVQESLFPPLTVSDAISELTLQCNEFDRIRARMSEILVELKSLPSDLPFHVEFVGKAVIYQGVVLTLKM